MPNHRSWFHSSRDRRPLIFDDLYVQALSRAALEERTPKLARADLQLIAMIDHARALLGDGIDRRVLIEGLSAVGMFSNRLRSSIRSERPPPRSAHPAD